MNSSTALLITTIIMALGAITFSSLSRAFQAQSGDLTDLPELDGYVLAPQSEVTLLRHVSGTGTDETMALIKSKLDSRSISIQYADIYDDIYEKREVILFKKQSSAPVTARRSHDR